MSAPPVAAALKVFKWPLLVVDKQTLMLPEGAEILCVQVQHGRPCIWAVVNDSRPLEARRFITHGTGHPMSAPAGLYIGTYQLESGELVFHVFEQLVGQEGPL